MSGMTDLLLELYSVALFCVFVFQGNLYYAIHVTVQECIQQWMDAVLSSKPLAGHVLAMRCKWLCFSACRVAREAGMKGNWDIFGVGG
jgi:hypothetical protein